jgi:uncharacterized membrane protein
MEGLRLGDNKGYVVAIAIALTVISTIIGVYYIWFRGTPEGYSTISILDVDGKAANYPELLIIGQNNTFNVWVNVENHMGKSLFFEVKVRITQQVNPDFPAPDEPEQVYELTLENGGKWNTTASTTISSAGSYMVVYELWAQNHVGTMEFTENYCVLSVQAKNEA